MIKFVIGFLVGVYCSFNFEWVQNIVEVFNLIENVDLEKVIPQKESSDSTN